MRRWEVVYTQQAETDLRNVYEYITFSLLEVELARNQTNRIMNGIISLDEMPLRFKVYDEEPWRSKGLRILPVDNYLIFYLPLEKQNTVAVIRIMYGGRNIDEQLKSTEENDD